MSCGGSKRGKNSPEEESKKSGHLARSRDHEPGWLKVFDELELGTRLWTVRVALALFDGLPEGGDQAKCLLAAFGVCGLDEPTADDHACAPDAAAAMDSAYAAATLVVPEDVEDGKHELL